jgi:arginine deiminase
MIRIPSETHRLQSLIVHTPGPEVSNVNPEIKNALLFDDIIFEQDARQEHLDMLEVFKVAMGPEGKIYEIIDLIKEVLLNEEAKASFIEGLIKALPEHNLYPIEKTLNKLSANELTKLVIEGHIDSLPHIHLYPSPNLLFTRDLAAVVGDNIVVSKAATKARVRESLLMECLIRFHPLFHGIVDRAIHVAGNNSIEGGDI